MLLILSASGISGLNSYRTVIRELDFDITDAPQPVELVAAAAALIEAFKSKRVLLSLAHNMAQPNQISAAMIDVITEFIHNDKVNPEQAVARLAQAVDNARG